MMSAFPAMRFSPEKAIGKDRSKMKNIIISGCNGKMGHVIASCILDRNDCQTVAGIDRVAEQYARFPVYAAAADVKEQADVIIDFSHPSALDGLLEYCKLHQTALVIATTGYSADQITRIKAAARNIPIFFSFNMSLGINLLAELAKKATAVLGGQFDIEIVEKHHNQKIDAPSGTALMLADAVNSVLDEKCQYVYDRHSQRKKRSKNEIGMHSIRGGTIVGEHDIIFAGRDEIVTLSHTAMSKEIFAVGAVNAAVFMAGKAPGLYDMGDMLSE